MHFSSAALHGVGHGLVDAISDPLKAIRRDAITTTLPAHTHDDYAVPGIAMLTALAGTTARFLTSPIRQRARPRHWKHTELTYKWQKSIRAGEFFERKSEAIEAYRFQFPLFTKEGIDIEGRRGFAVSPTAPRSHELFSQLRGNDALQEVCRRTLPMRPRRRRLDTALDRDSANLSTD